MQLNITTDYALRALFFLSEQERTCNSQAIGDHVSVSGEYIRKILRMLKTADMVTSDQGALGGYKLARPLDQISLLEVLRVTEDTMEISRRAQKAHGDLQGDPLLGFYDDIQSWLNDTLAGISLQDILDGKDNPFKTR